MLHLPTLPNEALNRRQLLRSSLALGAFLLPRPLPIPAAAATARRRAKSVIVILLEGGMSHLDTWDPKPHAPAEVRGEFGTTATSVPGLRFAEHLPRLARQAHRFNLVRSVHSSARNHEPGLHWVLTGFDYPTANTSTRRLNIHPAQGAVVAHQLGAQTRSGLPRYVAVPDRTQLGRRTMLATAAQLGAAYEAFETGEPPRARDHSVQFPPSLLLSADTPVSRLEDRRALLHSLDDLRRAHEAAGAVGRLDAYRAGAFELLTSQRLAHALDLSREPARVRESYGDAAGAGRPANRLDRQALAHRMGQGALLARRLVEAGVTYVLVNFSINNTWDTHANNFRSLKDTLLPPMDRAVSALLQDLDERGLLDDVLVMVTGEMGRTPVVNKAAGRDHWPDAYSVLLAGGGLTRGQVLGSTTAKGEKPGERPVPVADLLATIYHQLGIDPQAIFRDAQGRPVPILPEAKPVAELLG